MDRLFELHPELMHIRDGLIQCNPVALRYQPCRLERLGRWIAENPKGTGRLFPRVGRIFDMMAWLSGIMMIVAIVILVDAARAFCRDMAYSNGSGRPIAVCANAGVRPQLMIA